MFTKELDWRFEVKDHPRWTTELVLHPSMDQAGMLVPLLRSFLSDSSSGSDSSVTLRRGEDTWKLYLKIREGDSRALIAHSEIHEWVATLSFERSVWEVFVNSLEQGADFHLDQVTRLTGFSNFHLVKLR